MLAKHGELPRNDDAYGYEVKWDGVRAVAHVDAGHLTLTGRNGDRLHAALPGAARAGATRWARDG